MTFGQVCTICFYTTFWTLFAVIMAHNQKDKPSTIINVATGAATGFGTFYAIWHFDAFSMPYVLTIAVTGFLGQIIGYICAEALVPKKTSKPKVGSKRKKTQSKMASKASGK